MRLHLRDKREPLLQTDLSTPPNTHTYADTHTSFAPCLPAEITGPTPRDDDKISSVSARLRRKYSTLFSSPTLWRWPRCWTVPGSGPQPISSTLLPEFPQRVESVWRQILEFDTTWKHPTPVTMKSKPSPTWQTRRASPCLHGSSPHPLCQWPGGIKREDLPGVPSVQRGSLR